ncbi:MAG TPA: prolyl oligopeptidase family serine peptidase [Bryobacteraceae bacterium]|nr:prolyl oligopeptidase family serine peptidase [Bryobacteraceae bacterium]
MIADVHRAVRFVRSKAAKYHVDPDHLGISGGSAGCHLSLMVATQGATGKADAMDPIDRSSSAVQAVACFFPPTDFLNYGARGEDAVGVGTLKDCGDDFGPRSETAEGRRAYGKEISPIEFIGASTAPVLLIHGDTDKLAPLQQSETFLAKARETGVETKLVIKKDAAQGWPDLAADVPVMADWLDRHLRGVTK